ncbi:AMP-binding protein [Shewanella psychrotolerans]|uniref:AMP-binding protein n=1 Tax=Shewanella psychrotolerans TaxID=2864206 RepID=UPI001C65C87C|nr:AMP-binding protein [Shewanella psychrotolerans]QYK01223.1 AMP-binding protein [Shewanella psychrotolerans]
MALLISPLHHSAATAPKQTALNFWQNKAYHSLSYRELSVIVTSVATHLKQVGLKPGDRLACIDNNSKEMVILYWACIDARIIFCPLSPRFPKIQISELSQRYQFDRFWAPQQFQHLLPESSLEIDFITTVLNATPKTIDSSQPANIILTSGSSGQPKAAVHCLANHISSARGSSELIAVNQGDNWLLSLPLFHIGGLAIINRCALAQAAITLPATKLSLVEQLKQLRLTHLSLVATQLIRLLEQDKNALIGIKALLLGGGAIGASLLEKLKPLGINAYTSYGMTEMSSQITTGLATNKGSSGKLLAGRELKIVDQQIYVKGETLFMGYLTPKSPCKRPQPKPQELSQQLSQELPSEIHRDISQDNEMLWRPTDSEGWFNTQDLGYWNTDGDLVIIGRADNMFVCGGENVQPEEIEAALKRHPEITDAIVFPIPDSEFGFLPAAIINGSVSDTSSLDDFIRQYVASFKRPRQYFAWPNIESTSLKISRKQLIAAVSNPLA